MAAISSRGLATVGRIGTRQARSIVLVLEVVCHQVIRLAASRLDYIRSFIYNYD
jgi:hypothetical protein